MKYFVLLILILCTLEVKADVIEDRVLINFSDRLRSGLACFELSPEGVPTALFSNVSFGHLWNPNMSELLPIKDGDEWVRVAQSQVVFDEDSTYIVSYGGNFKIYATRYDGQKFTLLDTLDGRHHLGFGSTGKELGAMFAVEIGGSEDTRGYKNFNFDGQQLTTETIFEAKKPAHTRLPTIFGEEERVVGWVKEGSNKYELRYYYTQGDYKVLETSLADPSHQRVVGALQLEEGDLLLRMSGEESKSLILELVDKDSQKSLEIGVSHTPSVDDECGQADQGKSCTLVSREFNGYDLIKAPNGNVYAVWAEASTTTEWTSHRRNPRDPMWSWYPVKNSQSKLNVARVKGDGSLEVVFSSEHLSGDAELVVDNENVFHLLVSERKDQIRMIYFQVRYLSFTL